MTRYAILAWFGLAAGCGSKDCADLADRVDRDWCRYEIVQGQIMAGELDAGLASLDAIETPFVRSVAIDRLIDAAPTGLTAQKAEALCASLPDPYGSSCRKTWSRPHLWDR